jgi:hypothetical protein
MSDKRMTYGDLSRFRSVTEEYSSGYDRIFGKKKTPLDKAFEEMYKALSELGNT